MFGSDASRLPYALPVFRLVQPDSKARPTPMRSQAPRPVNALKKESRNASGFGRHRYSFHERWRRSDRARGRPPW